MTLNRPAAFNSFTQPMAAAFQAGLDAAAADEEIRCVVITGAGKAFCAGQDLKEITADDAPAMKDVVHGTYNTTVRKMRAMPKPIVAAVTIASNRRANATVSHLIMTVCDWTTRLIATSL